MSPITFQNSPILLLLGLLVPGALLLQRARRRRELVLADLAAEPPRPRHTARDRLRLAAVALLLLALARPGFGPRRYSIVKSGRDVVFVLDVSQSMLAQDTYPSRLNAAKEGVRDALDAFRSERVALVIYAGSANILCPLTYDYNFVRYMLDQATPRTVDFGGTALLSAVEKCTDSVLSAKRAGMQDLVVLTDGEDHNPQAKRIASLLNTKQLGLLLVGLGDPDAAARIPLPVESGQPQFLRYRDQFVATRLNDDGLRQLALTTNAATYVPAGTSPFDLAGLYAKYVQHKPISATVGQETYVVYREAGFPLIVLGLIFLLAAESLGPRRPAIALLMLLTFGNSMIEPSAAADLATVRQFQQATRLHRDGKFDQALAAYDGIAQAARNSPLSPAASAGLRFNQGLCYLAQAAAEPKDQPRNALMLARRAQSCFLAACRKQPGFRRAGRRLDPTARLIGEYERQVQQEEQRDKAAREQMQELVKRLQALYQQQITLRDMVPDPSSAKRTSPRKTGSLDQPTTSLAAPRATARDTHPLADRQQELHAEGLSIERFMKQIDQGLPADTAARGNVPASVLQQPRRLMKAVVSDQEHAAQLLHDRNTWPDARGRQSAAAQTIQQILDLLTSDQSSDSEKNEDSYDEDWELSEMSDSEQATTSSLQTRGDMARGAAMQPLPIPNYSVQDILQEEQGNQQFRRQQRTKGNQKKVEKDW